MATMAVPEIEVVQVGLTSDGADFAAFFRTEYPGIVALATAVTGDRQVGEDIAAEAMSRAFQRWDRVSGYDRPGAWTRRVAINLLHSRRRRLGSEIRAVLRLRPRLEVTAADSADAVVGTDRFHELLRPLAPRQRTAAALHYLDDLSVADIAELMGCSDGTVKSHLHAARAAIARTLEEHES